MAKKQKSHSSSSKVNNTFIKEPTENWIGFNKSCWAKCYAEDLESATKKLRSLLELNGKTPLTIKAL